MLLSFLLHEFLPGEPALNVIAQLYVKDIIWFQNRNLLGTFYTIIIIYYYYKNN